MAVEDERFSSGHRQREIIDAAESVFWAADFVDGCFTVLVLHFGRLHHSCAMPSASRSMSGLKYEFYSSRKASFR